MLVSFLIILSTVTTAVIAQILLKSGIRSIGVFPVSSVSVFIPFLNHVLTSPPILIGLLIYGVSTFVWIILLSRLDLSYLYPFGALQYVLVVFISHVYFGETLNLGRIGGISLILIGIFIIQKFESNITE